MVIARRQMGSSGLISCDSLTSLGTRGCCSLRHVAKDGLVAV